MRSDLTKLCRDIRRVVLNMAHDSKSSHVGSALSCVDILVSLFFGEMKPEDRFILSKGHAAMSYYAVLAEKGIIDKELLKTYSQNGSKFSEHPTVGITGIDVAAGSLGHGLSVAVGAALSRKIQKKDGIQYVLMGDGECNEGSVWEAAMVAGNMGLNNLVAIVDRNYLQAAGFCDNYDLAGKFSSFGWICTKCDGNNVESVRYAIQTKERAKCNNPLVVVAHTIKGCGVSFMENNLEWHYRYPNNEELKAALKEAGG